MQKTLINLKKGEKARVCGFLDGAAMRLKLEGMGIREGKIISRVSSQILGGPVIVSVDGRHTAMGRSIASKIMVESDI